MAGIVIELLTEPIRPAPTPGVVAADDFCACDFRCDFEELVFANDDANGITNDITDFLFRKISAVDTIVIEVLKAGILVATIVDDTYGTFFNGFVNQPLYVGWQADWTAIFNAFSGGLYKIKVTSVILGEASEFLSRDFRLNSFDERAANRTVKIETVQDGNFENSDFDFTGLLPGGWPTSIRLPGTFGNMSPKLERDIYQDSSYRDTQNRDTVIREYLLKCNLIPETIQEKIATKDMLGNSIFITSYDLLQEITYERLPLVPETFSEPFYDKLGRVTFEITLSDRQKNIIKRNF